MLPAEDKHRELRRIYDLAREAEVFEGGVTFQDDADILIVGNWALLAYDEEDELALSFHLNAHPVEVARLTRFLVEHDVEFVLYEAFVVNDRDEIVFESDLPDGAP
ncbi:MAG TPA: hypothetical protein VGW35_09690 [Methylomirabilota bacterium]|jgi:hypothetical protein|nr:hypothetical protein [Methylomirabilota bacterium]